MKPVNISRISIAALAVHCLVLSNVSTANDLGRQQVIQDLEGPDRLRRESFAHETKANDWQNDTVVSSDSRTSDLQQLSPRLVKKFKLKEKVKKVFKGGSSKPKAPSDSSSSTPSPAPEASSPQKTYESSPSQPSLSAGELARLQEELKTKLKIERVHSWVDSTISAGPASPNRDPGPLSPSVSQTHSRSRTPSRSPSRHSSPSSNRRRDWDQELQVRWFKHLTKKITRKMTKQRAKEGAKRVVKKVLCKPHARRYSGQMVKRCWSFGSDSSRRARERSRNRVDRWRGLPRQRPEERPWAGASPAPSSSHHSGSPQQGSQQGSPQQGSPQQAASPQPSEGAVSINVSPTQSPPAGSDNDSER